ncbi:hypothetical protein R4P64_07675 [Rhodococcus sp. IEGM 1366]|nr:hypothetical protein [Rhodococcus sp. IEGM 1366]MDV8066380.1 hypothetical protein [Rhodococcus sp. IEGM 1366]
MIVLSIAAVVVAVSGGLLWVAWRWARGFDSISNSDHYERRNY